MGNNKVIDNFKSPYKWLFYEKDILTVYDTMIDSFYQIFREKYNTIPTRNSNHRNRYYIGMILIFTLTFTNCKSKSSSLGRDEELYTIVKMERDGKYKMANEFIDKLIVKDKENATYYFEKGIIESKLEDFKSSITNFREAEGLGYKKDDCEMMIQFNQSLLDINHKYDRVGRKDTATITNKDSILH
ncbi:MAG: hypothetical protein NVSMB24_37680 [Mucilaginibacter sp.]